MTNRFRHPMVLVVVNGNGEGSISKRMPRFIGFGRSLTFYNEPDENYEESGALLHVS